MLTSVPRSFDDRTYQVVFVFVPQTLHHFNDMNVSYNIITFSRKARRRPWVRILAHVDLIDRGKGKEKNTYNKIVIISFEMTKHRKIQQILRGLNKMVQLRYLQLISQTQNNSIVQLTKNSTDFGSLVLPSPIIKMSVISIMVRSPRERTALSVKSLTFLLGTEINKTLSTGRFYACVSLLKAYLEWKRTCPFYR